MITVFMDKEGRQKYNSLYEMQPVSRLFTSPWWLDATCGQEGWNAVFQKDDFGEVITALPYHQTHIRGLSSVITPPMTQWVSILHIPGGTEVRQLSLLEGIPRSAILDLCIKSASEHIDKDRLFPIHLKYSYIIPAQTSMEKVRTGYNEGLKRNLKQARENYMLQDSIDIAGFLDLYLATHRQRNIKPPFWLNEVVPRVHAQLVARKCGNLSMALSGGKIIAGILTGWDQETMYYLAGGRTGDEQGASAHAFLLDQAIEKSRSMGTIFDFEGSMHPGIANFFQSFGAVPIPYWHIRKFTGLGKIWSLLH